MKTTIRSIKIDQLGDLFDNLFEHYRGTHESDVIEFQVAKTTEAGVRAVCKI